eukprot:TRINITY_DN30690_c0_g1_i1.p1 TRINITY_DN30690_c0_g1~~TRINITY_DN30690_c0_g1_i1.p1  ORF type:complete len:563 (+),score=180.76 TRINITY_DN30690_c0_g1_i1:162-1850(+)
MQPPPPGHGPGSRPETPATPPVKGQPAQDGTQNLDDDENDVPNVLQWETPEWFEYLLAATGIASLQYNLEVERVARADEFYQNPYPLTNSIVTSMTFEVFVACVIVFNSLLLGLEASVDEGAGLESMFSAMEVFFSIFFLCEWCARLVAFGWSWAFEFSNAADTVLVFGTGTIASLALSIIGEELPGMRIWTALRFLRLVRLAKAVRLYPMFHDMWILIAGLTTSARPLFWVAVMASVLLFVFAVAGTELIGRHPDFEEDEFAQELFGDLMASAFTLVQLITLDTWCDSIARPILAVSRKNTGLITLYFLSFVGVGVFIFWNLVTAIVVENAFAISEADEAAKSKVSEMEKKSELKGLANLFMEIDKDKSGALTLDELLNELDNPRVQQMLHLLELKADDILTVWNVLDDGDGQLTIKEFTSGIRRMKGDAKSKDIFDVVKRLRDTSRHQQTLRVQAERFCRSLRELENASNQIAADTDEVVGLFLEMNCRMTTQIAKGKQEDRLIARQREKERRLKAALEAQEKALEEERNKAAEKGPEKEPEDDEPPPPEQQSNYPPPEG